MGFSIYISVIHRYIQVAPLSWFYRQYNNRYIRFITHVVVFICVQLIIVPPIIILRISPELLEKESLETAPQLKHFFIHESSIFGYRRTVDTDVTKFMYILVGVFITLTLSMILLIINFFRIIKKNYNSFEHTAHKYQVSFLYLFLSPNSFFNLSDF